MVKPTRAAVLFTLIITNLLIFSPVYASEVEDDQPIGTMKVIESETSVYHVSDFKQNLEGARLFCSKSTEGYLVAIETDEENKFLQDQLTEDFYWTSGMYDDYFDIRSWVWASTGETINYPNWGPNQPITTDPAYMVAFYRSPIRSNFQVLPKVDGYHFICEIPKNAPVPCPQRNHLVIALDGSSSIDPQNFTLAKDFVALLATAFGPPSRISFIVYSSTSDTIFNLSNGLNPSQIQDAILTATQPRSTTATHLGIDAAVADLVRYSSGEPMKLVVFTDGQSNSPAQTTASANRAKASGVIAFSVGIDKFDRSELISIAGGVEGHMFTTDTFNSLIELIRPLSIKVCQA